MTDDDASELRRLWWRNWLCALLSLADIDLQRERWLNKEIANPHWSYLEFMCSYFDDPTNQYDHQAILDDPKWSEIIAKGRNSLQFLRTLIIDPTEQKIFSSKSYAPALTAGDFSWPLRPS